MKMECNDDSVKENILDKQDKTPLDKGNMKELKKQKFEEKQRLKMEEKMKKDLEKKQKEEEKRKKEIEKDLEKKKKEMEREEEKRKRDADRRQKEFEKEEEKRKKEEEKRLKEYEREEEKRRKEEERRKKEEEKRKEEEEKNKKLERQRAILMGFFSRERNDLCESTSCDLRNIGTFKPLDIKKDMKMSAIERIKKKKVQSLKDLMNTSKTYLDELLEGITGNGICDKTWPLPRPDIEVVNSKRLKTKSFLFVENIRPPYFGTWRKKSQIITPLNPLAEDKLFFDYEVDSDQEWECESGEDIASSDNEEDEEFNEEPEDISFLVPHGYLSDGEDIIDIDPEEDISSPVKKKPLSNETKQMMIDIREKQFQAEVKQQIHQINPKIDGPYFITNDDLKSGQNFIELYRMVCRTDDGFPINCNLQSDLEYSTNHSKIKSVPPEAVPHIIRLVHCNQMSRVKLCYEFRMFWEYNLSKKLPDVTFENDLQGKDWDEFSIGKKRFFEKLKEIADWKDGMWIVKPDVIQEYQLCCDDDNPEKPCTEKWKYVSEVVNIDSKKLLKPSQKSRKRKAKTDLTSLISEKSLKQENDTKPLLEKSS